MQSTICRMEKTNVTNCVVNENTISVFADNTCSPTNPFIVNEAIKENTVKSTEITTVTTDHANAECFCCIPLIC